MLRLEKRVTLTWYSALPLRIGIFLGGLTLLAAIACLIMLGTPSEVWWLSKRERAMANGTFRQ